MPEPDPTINPTAGDQKPEVEAKPEPKGVMFSEEQQNYLNKLLAETKREAKESASKKFADYADLQAKAKKLVDLETAKLSEEEQKKKQLDDLQAKIDAKEKELSARNLRDLKRSKIEQAIADGKMTLPAGKTIDSVVKRSTATTEDEIDADIEDLIGFFPPAKAPDPTKKLGTDTHMGDDPKAKTLQEQVAAKNAAIKDPKLTYRERDQLMKEVISLNNRIMRGET
jgi:hypothetical protein